MEFNLILWFMRAATEGTSCQLKKLEKNNRIKRKKKRTTEKKDRRREHVSRKNDTKFFTMNI